MNSRIKKRVDQHKVISFDIFDTIIERKVDIPTDIFRVVGEEVLGTSNAEAFYHIRKEAEARSREGSSHGEVSLDDIYKVVAESYPDQAQKLMEAEVETEIRSCVPKEAMQPIWTYAKEHDKVLIFLSDMYLPQNVIEEMLRICGITGYKKCYVSNTYGVNKISGELYRKMLEEEHCSEKDVLHIGDSIKADFLGARKAGVKSVLIGRRNRLKRFLCAK